MTLSLPSTAPSTTITALKQQVHNYLGGPSVVTSIDKIKILLNKKPIPASKQTVADIVNDATTKDVELGVMVMGGAPDPAPQNTEPGTSDSAAEIPEPEVPAPGPGSENAVVEAETGVNPAEDSKDVSMDAMEDTQDTSQSQPVQPGGDSGDAVLQTDEFWGDLEGFLAQRIRSAEDATRLRGVFERAWRSGSAAP